MTVITKENLVDELKKAGTLMELLRPEQFAEPDQVADRIAASYVKEGEMKTTQLRKVFHTLKENERMVKGKKDEDQLDTSTTTRIRLLVPEIAYARGRKLIPQEFYELMRLCLSSNKLKTVGDLRILMQLLTAILAYQKYHEKVKGGKEQ